MQTVSYQYINSLHIIIICYHTTTFHGWHIVIRLHLMHYITDTKRWQLNGSLIPGYHKGCNYINCLKHGKNINIIVIKMMNCSLITRNRKKLLKHKSLLTKLPGKYYLVCWWCLHRLVYLNFLASSHFLILLTSWWSLFIMEVLINCFT